MSLHSQNSVLDYNPPVPPDPGPQALIPEWHNLENQVTWNTVVTIQRHCMEFINLNESRIMYNNNSNNKPGKYEGEEEVQEEEPNGCKGRACAIFKKNIFLLFLLLGIIAGVVIGILIKVYVPDFHEDKRSVMYLAFPGDIFLRMLKCMIIPLIVCSLISGMANLPVNASGSLGGFTVLYYLITTIMAVLLGILLVCTIEPGNRGNNDAEGADKMIEPVDSLLDLIRNALPNNIIGACTSQTKTIYISEDVVTWMNETMGNETTEVSVMTTEMSDFSVTSVSGSNVLGLVVFSTVLGVIIGQMRDKGVPVKNFVDSLLEAVLKMVRLIIWYSPIGICFILAARIAGMEDPAAEFASLGWYMLTVLLGLFIHAFIVLPLIYLIFTRKNPFKLMFNMTQALLTALGTASSSATLPITMDCLENKAKVDQRVSRFVLPVGATINMDGTALYEAVASIFIAQSNNISLNAGQIVTVSVTATAAAIGAAGVPEAGLVTMLIVLTAVGLPTEDIALILAVDWFVDRFRTAVNVWGDSIGAGIVEKLAKNKLTKEDDWEGNGEKPSFEVNGPMIKGNENKAFTMESSRL